jgi:hypothetical protein
MPSSQLRLTNCANCILRHAPDATAVSSMGVYHGKFKLDLIW